MVCDRVCVGLLNYASVLLICQILIDGKQVHSKD
jgi:hypothetical protein